MASTFVGVDPARGTPLYRKLYIAAVGPEGTELGDEYPEFRACVREKVVEFANSTSAWLNLDTNVMSAYDIAVAIAAQKEEVTPEKLQAELRREREKVRLHFVNARRILRAAVRVCGPSRFTSQLKFGLVNHVCTGQQAVACRSLPDNYNSAQFFRYAKVYDWFQTAGIRPVNEVVELGPEGLVSTVQYRLELHPDKPWPAEPPFEDIQRAFEAGVIRLRRGQHHYSYVAPLVLRIRKETAERLVDAIDHPVFSIPALPRFADAGKDVLLILQDEIARSRITQCVVYQAQKEPELASKCAGYKLSAGQLQSCLSGLACLPELEPTAYIHSLSIAAPRSLRDLAITEVPRLIDGLSEEQFAEYLNDCTKKHREPQEVMFCLTRRSISPQSAALFDCTVAASRKNAGRRGAQECLMAQLDSADAQRIVSCLNARKNTSAALVSCTMDSALDPGQVEKLRCLRSSLDARSAESIAQCVSGNERTQLFIRCSTQHKGDTDALMLCLLDDKRVPPEVSKAIKCAKRHPDDIQKFGGCVLTEKLLDGSVKGNVGRGLACAVSSGGSAIGTASCIGAPRMKPQEQIAVECLSQSADALSYAGCVGGRLTLKELGQCRNVDYGKSGCYGPNNDIRKFLRAAGINTDSGTLVGKLASLHVKFASNQLAFAEGMFGTGVRVIEDVGHFAEGFGKSFEKLTRSLVDGASNGIRKAGRTIRKVFGL